MKEGFGGELLMIWRAPGGGRNIPSYYSKKRADMQGRRENPTLYKVSPPLALRANGVPIRAVASRHLFKGGGVKGRSPLPRFTKRGSSILRSDFLVLFSRKKEQGLLQRNLDFVNIRYIYFLHIILRE
ncbi:MULTISPECIES: hypothetical protein [Anaerotruncus]|uniref:Uncharacterized protein n=1 Tax=Anaerotruncus massiliensis (ex Togo et al. 2019) TaxID=1673720 RepID=A0ABR7AHH7_9FIRM|nr:MULTISPECIES: hypothetical protein [Anaerotruncus]MBC3939903.1 hypothetical protein [Anaerotruncus massiliensis (ex Togo et al. 2019)]